MIAMPTDNKPVGFMCMESDSGTLRSVFPWGARSLHSYLEEIESYPTLYIWILLLPDAWTIFVFKVPWNTTLLFVLVSVSMNSQGQETPAREKDCERERANTDSRVHQIPIRCPERIPSRQSQVLHQCRFARARAVCGLRELPSIQTVTESAANVRTWITFARNMPF